MLAGEVQRREQRIAAIQREVAQYTEKIAALDSAMALVDDRVNPEALGAMKCTAERYEGYGGLTKFLISEIFAAGVVGIDSVQLTLRAACRFEVPLESSRDIARYRKTVGWTLRALRKKGEIQNLFFSRGGHKPSVWKCRNKQDSFEELLRQSDALERLKNGRN